MKMVLGISKRHWLLIFAAVLSVVIINVIGIWIDLPSKAYTEKFEDMAPGVFDSMNCDPQYLTVFLMFLLVAVVLTATAWFAVFLSKKPFLQGLSAVLRYASELLTAILVGGIFAAISICLAANWIDHFWCGPLYGLLWSPFVVEWSMKFAFPATSLLIFWAMRLSNQHYYQPSHNEELQ